MLSRVTVPLARQYALSQVKPVVAVERVQPRTAGVRTLIPTWGATWCASMDAGLMSDVGHCHGPDGQCMQCNVAGPGLRKSTNVRGNRRTPRLRSAAVPLDCQ